MGQSIIVQWDDIRSVAFGTIPASPLYAPIGTPFLHAARMLIIQNFTDQLVYVSDEIDLTVPAVPTYVFIPKIILPSGGQIILDYMSDKSLNGGEFAQSAGTQLYTAYPTGGVAPTLGNIYVSVIYALGE
jgi:hypothetical protein